MIIHSGRNRLRSDSDHFGISHRLVNFHLDLYYGDPDPISAGESTGDTLTALVKYFPQLMQTYNASVLPTAQTQLNAAQQISPAYNELLSNLYATYGPKAAETGAKVDAISKEAGAQSDVDVLNKHGVDISKAYRAADEAANPEAYKVKGSAADKLVELLGATDLNNANPEAERLVNQENIRTGNINAPASATTTTANALQFGEERNKRIANLSDAVSKATAFLTPASNAQFNPATTILNKPTSNTGQSQFSGVTNPDQTAYASGQGFMNNIAGFQSNVQQIAAQKRDVVDRINEGFNAL